MAVSYDKLAKPSKTEFEVLAQKDKFALLKIRLHTGRTHQIRVHMESIGHPVIGDQTYGNRKMNKEFQEKFAFTRQFLHAFSLGFIPPESKESIQITSPLPEDLLHILKTLNLYEKSIQEQISN